MKSYKLLFVIGILLYVIVYLKKDFFLGLYINFWGDTTQKEQVENISPEDVIRVKKVDYYRPYIEIINNKMFKARSESDYFLFESDIKGELIMYNSDGIIIHTNDCVKGENKFYVEGLETVRYYNTYFVPLVE